MLRFMICVLCVVYCTVFVVSSHYALTVVFCVLGAAYHKLPVVCYVFFLCYFMCFVCCIMHVVLCVIRCIFCDLLYLLYVVVVCCSLCAV